VWGGFGYAQESWVFSMGHLAQLSELSGEVVWNGPYNRGIIGPYAFDKGWQGLPFWISKDKELCTMLPDGNGPIAISTEYERSLLSQIPDDTITMSLIGGTNYVENFTSYGKGVELVYFSDPPKNIEVLRIKFKQTNGVAVVIIHDFNLRDDLSPYGQGYQSVYQSVLQNDFTSIRILDHQRRARIWAGGNDNYFYQFYKGATDNGVEFPASAITMRYLGGDRTALKTIEWYGDQTIKWYVLDHMLGSDVVADSSQWVDITDQMRPFPGDENSAHWQCDLNRPEMIHCYLWIQLQSHSADAPDPTDPNKLSSPIPHCPLETYGKLYLAAPIIGDTRGR
jgi:hypothetical protein